MTNLDSLRSMTVIVEDTGDFEKIKRHKPRDATTNPSLLYSAAGLPQYSDLVKEAIDSCSKRSKDCDIGNMDGCLDKLAVTFALEILKIVPRRVSVEVNAALSFDTQRTVEKARTLIGMFDAAGIDRERILIKIASTWEGIRAAGQLEKEGIHCNLTLLFSMAQAIACADAGVTLISPFVGRIYDWHRLKQGVDSIPAAEDPGVHSVTAIYNYYKHFGYSTEVMGASFRNTGEIKELAGCDLLTISPQLLSELDSQEGELPRKLSAETAGSAEIKKIELDEAGFRWMMNEDAMATDKLSEGIRKFYADLVKLATFVREVKCTK